MERRFAIRVSGQDEEGLLSFAREVEGLLLERGVMAEVSSTAAASSGGGTETMVLLNGRALEPAAGGTTGRETSPDSPAPDVVLDVALDPAFASPRALVFDLGMRGVAAAAAEVLLALERLGIVPPSPGTSYSEEDERKIADRLEDLGYL